MGLIWIRWRKSADRGKRKYSRFLPAANASPRDSRLYASGKMYLRTIALARHAD